MIVSTRDSQIQELHGNHKPGRSNQDIATFYAFNPTLRYIPKKLGSLFPNLKTLLITKSNLRFIEFRDFKNMKKLLKLYLPENRIEKIPICAFRHVENLEIIDFNGNIIKELNEDTFLNLPNLEYFSANDNQIEHLEGGLFRNNHNLKKISMQQNKLLIIEVNFMKIKGIELVDLRFNPCVNLSFGCCKGPALREFQNYTSGSCNGPEVC